MSSLRLVGWLLLKLNVVLLVKQPERNLVIHAVKFKVTFLFSAIVCCMAVRIAINVGSVAGELVGEGKAGTSNIVVWFHNRKLRSKVKRKMNE